MTASVIVINIVFNNHKDITGSLHYTFKKSMLRIRMFIPDPGFFYPSWISDLESTTAKDGGKLVVLPFSLVANFTKLKFF
jgi:hypothetical protein